MCSIAEPIPIILFTARDPASNPAAIISRWSFFPSSHNFRNASAGTSGVNAGASGGQKDAVATGAYQKGMAVFTIAKGGLMYAATIAGQKFSYTPRGAAQ